MEKYILTFSCEEESLDTSYTEVSNEVFDSFDDMLVAIESYQDYPEFKVLYTGKSVPFSDEEAERFTRFLNDREERRAYREKFDREIYPLLDEYRALESSIDYTNKILSLHKEHFTKGAIEKFRLELEEFTNELQICKDKILELVNGLSDIQKRSLPYMVKLWLDGRCKTYYAENY